MAAAVVALQGRGLMKLGFTDSSNPIMAVTAGTENFVMIKVDLNFKS